MAIINLSQTFRISEVVLYVNVPWQGWIIGIFVAVGLCRVPILINFSPFQRSVRFRNGAGIPI